MPILGRPCGTARRGNAWSKIAYRLTSEIVAVCSIQKRHRQTSRIPVVAKIRRLGILPVVYILRPATEVPRGASSRLYLSATDAFHESKAKLSPIRMTHWHRTGIVTAPQCPSERKAGTV